MSIYRYADDSAVREVVFHHVKGRPIVALLSAADTATPEQVSAVRAAIESAGWQGVPVYVEGKPILQVTGFKEEAALDGLLRKHSFTRGTAVITAQPGDNPHSSTRDRIKRNSLKLAGLLNVLGNVQLMLDGSMKRGEDGKRDYYRMTGGGLLLVGGANLARYGSAKADQYTQEVTQDLARYIRSQGGELPLEGSIPRRKGTRSRIENFLYRYPAQVTLGVDTVGAASNLLSGIKEARKKGKWGGLVFGANSFGLKLVSWLIPEKSRDEKKKDSPPEKRNLLEKTADWIREKPLRFYGYGSLIGDAALGYEAFENYTPGKMNHIFKAGAAVSYALADLMMTISSKDHVNAEGKFTADEQRSIEAMAAAAVAAKPEEERMPMAEKLGKFLVKRREIKGDPGSITQSIIEQARHREENPWAKRIANDANALPGNAVGT